MPIKWDIGLNTGIAAIDAQHMRIVDFINQLEEAVARNDRSQVGQILDDCVEYTLSHFAFEESLQKQAGYSFLNAHKRVHDLFAGRINEYRQRFLAGEDLGSELYDLLSRWLVNHIRKDDADYVSAVKACMDNIVQEQAANPGWLKRFFK